MSKLLNCLFSMNLPFEVKEKIIQFVMSNDVALVDQCIIQ